MRGCVAVDVAVLLTSLFVAVMCVKSMNATKTITAFYDETDGRLGSSAIVHLKSVEEPLRSVTVPYVRREKSREKVSQDSLTNAPCVKQASKLQLACHTAREQYTKIFDTFQVGPNCLFGSTFSFFRCVPDAAGGFFSSPHRVVFVCATRRTKSTLLYKSCGRNDAAKIHSNRTRFAVCALYVFPFAKIDDNTE